MTIYSLTQKQYLSFVNVKNIHLPTFFAQLYIYIYIYIYIYNAIIRKLKPS